MENYKNKYLKYKKKYLKYKELIGGSDRQIFGFSTADLEIFNNLECQEIMSLAKTNKSLNILIKNNIIDIYKLNNKIDKNFFPEKIDNDYNQFVNICILNQINNKIKDIDLYELNYVENYEDLILLTKNYGSDNLLRIIKLDESLRHIPKLVDSRKDQINQIFNLLNNSFNYSASNYSISISSIEFLTEPIIKNMIKLLNEGFLLRDSIQYSIVSIPRTKEEVLALKDEFIKDTLDIDRIYKNDIELSPDTVLELNKLLEAEIINQPNFDLIINKKINEYKINKRIRHYGRDRIIDDNIINNLILLSDLPIKLNDKLNMCYKIEARTDEEIDKIISFKKIGIDESSNILLALKYINIDKFKELKSIGFSDYYAILGSKIDNIMFLKQLKLNKFNDYYCYQILLNKNEMISIEKLIQLKIKGVSESEIYKIVLFYNNETQFNNFLRMYDNNQYESELNFNVGKNLSSLQIDLMFTLININIENINPSFDEYGEPFIEDFNKYIIYEEFKNYKYDNLYYIFYDTVLKLNQEEIQKMAEFLELKFSPQTSYLASKNFKNEVQKKMLIDLKNADLNEKDAYLGALVLTTENQKNEFIEKLTEYYSLDLFNYVPELHDIYMKFVSDRRPRREPTAYTVDMEEIYLNIRIKKIFIQDLLFKILNPGQVSNYNRFAIELGVLDDNLDPIE